MPMPTREAQREYQRNWMAARRKEWFDANGPCVDCETWEALELDHVDPAEKVTHAVWSWAKVRREAELAKCVVRCEPCHKARTIKQQTIDHPHGTTGRYHKGCRCAACKTAIRDWFREYRANKGLQALR